MSFVFMPFCKYFLSYSWKTMSDARYYLLGLTQWTELLYKLSFMEFITCIKLVSYF